MSGAQYPINTLDEMASIPDEALPRFLAELPDLLVEIKRVRAAVKLADPAHVAFGDVYNENCIWIDDDLKQMQTTIEFGADDLAQIKYERQIGGAA